MNIPLAHIRVRPPRAVQRVGPGGGGARAVRQSHPHEVGVRDARGLRHVEEPGAFPELEGAYSITRPPIKTKAQFIACKKLIADERRRRYMLPRRAFLRLRSLSLRKRAKPADTLLASVVRLPNELVWKVLAYWRCTSEVTGEVI